MIISKFFKIFSGLLLFFMLLPSLVEASQSVTATKRKSLTVIGGFETTPSGPFTIRANEIIKWNARYSSENDNLAPHCFYIHTNCHDLLEVPPLGCNFTEGGENNGESQITTGGIYNICIDYRDMGMV